MSKEHVVYRVIDGTHYQCKDTGCNDFDRAEYNRYIIEHNLFLAGYRAMEQAIRHTPLDQPLPGWIPLGCLPQMTKAAWQQFSGGQARIYEIIESEVVGD